MMEKRYPCVVMFTKVKFGIKSENLSVLNVWKDAT